MSTFVVGEWGPELTWWDRTTPLPPSPLPPPIPPAPTLTKPRQWATRWERLTFQSDRPNQRRHAYAQATLDQLEALTAEDRAWLADHGYDVKAAISSCISELAIDWFYR